MVAHCTKGEAPILLLDLAIALDMVALPPLCYCVSKPPFRKLFGIWLARHKNRRIGRGMEKGLEATYSASNHCTQNSTET